MMEKDYELVPAFGVVYTPFGSFYRFGNILGGRFDGVSTKPIDVGTDKTQYHDAICLHSMACEYLDKKLKEPKNIWVWTGHEIDVDDEDDDQPANKELQEIWDSYNDDGIEEDHYNMALDEEYPF